MNVVIYARYSSFGQREESIEGQLKACYEYANLNRYIVLDEYIDRAATATNDDRKQFQNMIADSEKKQFEGVLVYQFDRFARNRYDSAINKGKLKKNGVRVISVKENISDDPSGVMLEGILETLAEYYSADLSQKVKRGQTTNAEKCVFNGGGIPLGYKIGKNKHFQIDEDTAPIVKHVFEQYTQGKNVTDIIDELNNAGLRTHKGTPFARNSLQNLLRNRKYTGVYIYGDIEIPNGIPRIIDDDVFNIVQEKIQHNKQNPSSKGNYLLTTKLFCGHCESMMIGISGTSKTGKVHNYYVCKKVRAKNCTKTNVKQKYIEDVVVNECRKILTDKNISDIAEKVSALCVKESNSPYMKQLKKELTQAQSAIENLMKALEKGEETDLILDRIKAKRKDQNSIESQLAMEELTNTMLAEPEIKFFLSEIKNGNINDDKYRKMLVNVLVNKIYLYDDKMTIFYNAGGRPVEISTQLREEIDKSESSYGANCASPQPRNFNDCGVLFFCNRRAFSF